MAKKVGFIPLSLETLIAVCIALASLATALTAWRTNVVNSQASNSNREGLINAIKKSAADGENWRQVYQEAGYARDYLLEGAAIEAMENSTDSLDLAVAANMREYLLSNLKTLADPMGSDPAYQQADGTLDTQKRFGELHAKDGDLAGLNPPGSFAKAAQYNLEQRFLTIGVVLLAASLFWFGLAEITPGSMKGISLAAGGFIFLGSLSYLFIIELVFIFVRRGGL